MVRVVLSTNNLGRLRSNHGISEPVGLSPFHIADTPADISALLLAAFADPVDFTVFSVPKRLALLADHDEYTTIFGMSKSAVSRIATPLKQGAVPFVSYEPQQPL